MGRPSDGRSSVGKPLTRERHSDAQAIQTQSELGRLSEGPSAILLRRNREITEVRDELLRTQQRVDGAHMKNKVLLEETSELDSEVFAQSCRAAAAEQRLSELHDEAVRLQEGERRGEGAHAARAGELQREIASHAAVSERASAQAREHRGRAGVADAEIDRLRGLLSEEDAVASRLRKALQDPGRGELAASSAAAAAEAAMESRLGAIEVRRGGHVVEDVAARRRMEELEAVHTTEMSQHDRLTRELSDAAAGRSSEQVRLDRLEAALAARGCDVSAALARSLGADDVGDGGMAEAAAEALWSEVRAAEEQASSLKASLQRTKESDEKAFARLQTKLDAARDELQVSLRQASEAHGVEVTHLENEIQDHRKREVTAANCERTALERVEVLRAACNAAALELPAHAAADGAESSHCADLELQLSRARAAATTSAKRFEAARLRGTDMRQRRRAAEEEGEQRIGKVRAMLEELWAALRRQAGTSQLLGSCASGLGSGASGFGGGGLGSGPGYSEPLGRP